MLGVGGVTYIYRQIDYPSIVAFVRVFTVKGITYIY
jgi:hypothetical protein